MRLSWTSSCDKYHYLSMTTPFFPHLRPRLAALGRRVHHQRQHSLTHLEQPFGPFLPPGLLSQSEEVPNRRERQGPCSLCLMSNPFHLVVEMPQPPAGVGLEPGGGASQFIAGRDSWRSAGFPTWCIADLQSARQGKARQARSSQRLRVGNPRSGRLEVCATTSARRPVQENEMRRAAASRRLHACHGITPPLCSRSNVL